MSTTPEELQEEVLDFVKDTIGDRVEKFSKTPLGIVLDAAGQEMMDAKEAGREYTILDMASFCLKTFKKQSDAPENGDGDNAEETE